LELITENSFLNQGTSFCSRFGDVKLTLKHCCVLPKYVVLMQRTNIACVNLFLLSFLTLFAINRSGVSVSAECSPMPIKNLICSRLDLI
jgi:hypothetical protein